MSIINEALKKAIREKEQTVPNITRTHLEKTLMPSVESRKSRVNWGPIFITLVLLLITAPILAPIFTSPFKNSKSATPETLLLADLPAEASSSNKKAQFGVEEAPLFGQTQAMRPSFSSGYLNLTGVVSAEDGSYCIINDKVLKSGDYVGGAKVTSIQSNTVKLNSNGQDITLTIAR